MRALVALPAAAIDAREAGKAQLGLVVLQGLVSHHARARGPGAWPSSTHGGPWLVLEEKAQGVSQGKLEELVLQKSPQPRAGRLSSLEALLELLGPWDMSLRLIFRLLLLWSQGCLQRLPLLPSTVLFSPLLETCTAPLSFSLSSSSGLG